MIPFSVHYFALFILHATFAPYFQVLLKSRGFEKSQIGLLLAGAELCGVLGPFLLARLADRLGRRKGILMAATLISAGLAVPLAQVESFWAALPMVMAFGFAVRTAIPMTDALASAELPDPAHQYGRVRAFGTIGFVGTLLVIRLFTLVDETRSVSMMHALVVGALACFCTALLVPDRHRRTTRPALSARDGGDFDRSFWLWMLAILASQFGMGAHYAFFTLYGREVLGLQYAAWLWAIGSATELPFIFFGGWFVRRWGLRWMLGLAMLAVTVRLWTYAALPYAWSVIPIQATHALTFGVFHCATIEYLRRKVDPARLGTGMAILMGFRFGLASVLAASMGGFLLDAFADKPTGYAMLYGLYGIPPLLAGLAVLLWRKGFALPGPRQAARGPEPAKA